MGLANGVAKILSMLSSIQSISYDQTKTGRKLVIEWGDDEAVIPGCSHHNNSSKGIKVFSGSSLDEIFNNIQEAFSKRSEQSDRETDQTCKSSKIHVD